MSTAKNPLHFVGSHPDGRRAEIRTSETPFPDGYSVFTWRDTPATGVICWREHHGCDWATAHQHATQWLRDVSTTAQPAPLSGPAADILSDVFNAMQNAEELGGTRGRVEYVRLMLAIAAEATRRAGIATDDLGA